MKSFIPLEKLFPGVKVCTRHKQAATCLPSMSQTYFIGFILRKPIRFESSRLTTEPARCGLQLSSIQNKLSLIPPMLPVDPNYKRRTGTNSSLSQERTMNDFVQSTAWFTDHTGKFQQKLNEHFFLTDPDTMIWTHYPYDEMENNYSRWQLLDVIVSLEEFNALPKVTPYFFDYNMKIRSRPQNPVVFKGSDPPILTNGVPFEEQKKPVIRIQHL
ncbi:kyphoscoliosis peptidase [Trichonephila clavipes]|uniref:Kyphoscoliosis peptidase n=1 Tax=Trichonephila clavipes TaxID=2585209 RepID=A0A8X6SH50_TRICX|nr:kyphoscoliosis peptidase [Trichonephila clavipes]